MVKHDRFNLVIFLSLLLLCAFAKNAYAQQPVAQQNLQNKLKDIIGQSSNDIFNKGSSENKDPARPESLAVTSSDPLTKKLYEKALQDYYIYRSEGLQHRRAVFIWQLFSAKLIFVIVLLLVASGIIFAAIQFRRGSQSESNTLQTKENMSTEMEISAKGVRINSPVLGVIILTISLAFFYLYLVYVYPIENIF